MEYWEYLDKVGMMHVGQGRTHPLHVEYVHIGVTLSFIQDVLTEAILSHPRMRMEKKISLVKAIGKLIWIQNDLFAKWYVRDGDEYKEEMEAPEIEREGYLHGKKILSDSGESDIEDDPPASSCPFKNLMREPKEPVTTPEDASGIATPPSTPPTPKRSPVHIHCGIPRPLGNSAAAA